MDSTITRRPMRASLAIVGAATAITLTAAVLAPPAPPRFGVPELPSSTQAIALKANALEQIWAIATGTDSHYPLPAGVNPVAPITEQVVRSAATYARQLTTGQAGQIPAELSVQAANLADAVPEVAGLLIEDVAVVPLALFSAAFLSLLVIGSLPASAPELTTLPEIWLNAVTLPPLKWTYNAFAIRNTVAVALQPPSPSVPAAAVPADSTSPQLSPEPRKRLAAAAVHPGARPGLSARASESKMSHPVKRPHRAAAENRRVTTDDRDGRPGKHRAHMRTKGPTTTTISRAAA